MLLSAVQLRLYFRRTLVRLVARAVVRRDVVDAILVVCLLADDPFVHIPSTAFHLERLSVFISNVIVLRRCCHHAADGLHLVLESIRR
jgi:hypothetical protein